MKVLTLLESRRAQWIRLEQACGRLESQRVATVPASDLVRFASLYRAACADLALADAYQLPPNTVSYLHELVGRAHNQLYRSNRFQVSRWSHLLFVTVPRQLFHDGCLRLAMAVFWGTFIAAMATAYISPTFAETLLGKESLQDFERMYDSPINGRDSETNSKMAGFYVQHNASIGLQCFAAGMLLGVGGLFTTISNAAILGGVFGYMATLDVRENFFNFVTAHGPFELTAIVLGAAAGMRLGFSLIDTHGYTRRESLRRAAHQAIAPASVSVILFCLAAVIEGFVSPSGLPYWVKASVALVSTIILLVYLLVLGYSPEAPDAA